MLQRSFLLDSPPLSPIQRLAAGVLGQLIADVRASRHRRRYWKTYCDTEAAAIWCGLAGLPVSVFLASAERHFRRPPPVPDVI